MGVYRFLNSNSSYIELGIINLLKDALFCTYIRWCPYTSKVNKKPLNSFCNEKNILPFGVCEEWHLLVFDGSCGHVNHQKLTRIFIYFCCVYLFKHGKNACFQSKGLLFRKKSLCMSINKMQIEHNKVIQTKTIL